MRSVARHGAPVATTNPVGAALLLDHLTQAGVGFAVTHRESEVAIGEVVSDVDLLVDREPHSALAAMFEAGPPPLRLVVIWPYDLRSVTTFWLTDDGRSGVQLDFVGDPDGLGRYGFKTDAFLERASAGARWRRLHSSDELAYLARKRAVKGQSSGINASGVLGDAGPDRTEELVANQTARRALSQSVLRTHRYATRLRSPIGHWVELVGGSEASVLAGALSSRFRSTLVTAEAYERPTGRSAQWPWWLKHIAPIRWRPGIVVSWCRNELAAPHADVRVRPDGRDADEYAAAIVNAMSESAMRRLQVRVSDRRTQCM